MKTRKLTADRNSIESACVPPWVVHRCPCCGATIGIDPVVMLAKLPRTGSWPGHDLAGDMRPPFVVFRPGPAAGPRHGVPPAGPCEHMVSLYLSGVVSRPNLPAAAGGSTAARLPGREFDLEWHHPWFAGGDPDQDLLNMLWSELSGLTGEDDDEEVARFVAARIFREYAKAQRPVPGRSWTLDYWGWFIASPDPDILFADLPGCVRRIRAAWEWEERAAGRPDPRTARPA